MLQPMYRELHRKFRHVMCYVGMSPCHHVTMLSYMRHIIFYPVICHDVIFYHVITCDVTMCVSQHRSSDQTSAPTTSALPWYTPIALRSEHDDYYFERIHQLPW